MHAASAGDPMQIVQPIAERTARCLGMAVPLKPAGGSQPGLSAYCNENSAMVAIIFCMKSPRHLP
jgi:hypothetical protein